MTVIVLLTVFIPTEKTELEELGKCRQPNNEIIVALRAGFYGLSDYAYVPYAIPVTFGKGKNAKTLDKKFPNWGSVASLLKKVKKPVTISVPK